MCCADIAMPTQCSSMYYTKAPPLRYSVKTRATSPSMANLPFQSSASELIISPDFDSTLTPLKSGTSDAREKMTAVPTNQGNPPLASCATTLSPLANSAPIAATNPTIASRPLILSGAGPLNARTSQNLVLGLGCCTRNQLSIWCLISKFKYSKNILAWYLS